MTTQRESFYSAPIFLGTAFLLFGIAILEKALNLVGWSIPLIHVLPSQVLGWAVTLLAFEIALTLRQLVELQRTDRSGDARSRDPRLN